MKSTDRFKSTIGFIDMLFNILVGFAFLFMIAFLLIKPEAKKEDFERKAEFIITMEWDHDAADDIDLYVSDPQGGIVSFRHPTIHLMHLDKDDLGSRNDTVMVNGRSTTISLNREVVTIRGFQRGEYIVNAHYYSNREEESAEIVSADRHGPGNKSGRTLTVRVEVIKVNPYKILWVGDHKFNRRGQEETFVRFRLDDEGKLLPPVTFQEKEFVAPNRIGAAQPSTVTGREARDFMSATQQNVEYEGGDVAEEQPHPDYDDHQFGAGGGP